MCARLKRHGSEAQKSQDGAGRCSALAGPRLRYRHPALISDVTVGNWVRVRFARIDAQGRRASLLPGPFNTGILGSDSWENPAQFRWCRPASILPAREILAYPPSA